MWSGNKTSFACDDRLCLLKVMWRCLLGDASLEMALRSGGAVDTKLYGSSV